MEGFGGEAAVGERFCSSLGGSACLRSCNAKRVALENSDAYAAKLSLVVRTQGNRSGECVASVRSEHHFEEGAHVCDGAGHWTDSADPGKSAGAWRKMSRGRNAAGRGLQSADSTKMCGDANRAASIAAHAAG